MTPEAASTESTSANTFKLPSEHDLRRLARDFKLNAPQIHALDRVLLGVSSSLHLGIPDRSTEKILRTRLTSLQRALKALCDVLDEDPATLRGALPTDAVEAIGALLPPFVNERGEPVPERTQQLLAYHAAGPTTLSKILHTIKDPIDKFIDEGRAERVGGREPKHDRLLLLMSLADQSDSILGRRAAYSANGPFVRFCAAVLSACNISTTGLDDALKNVLRQLKEDA